MAMASGLYLPTYRDALDTSNIVVDFLLSTNKVILVTNSETPNFETHDLYADITGEVAAGGGYTQNNKTVGGTPTWAFAAATTRLKYSWSAAVEWTSSTITARGMILTTAADGYLMVASDFGQDYISTNGTFSITAHADGILYFDLW